MYITTSAPNTITQIINQADCPVICEQEYFAYFNLTGILFGFLCIAAILFNKKYFIHGRTNKKKLVSKTLSILFWTFLVLFVLYFLKIEYHQSTTSCIIKGILVNINFFPNWLHPLYGIR